MKGKINFDCYKNNGGTDKVSAINYTGVKLNKYDKVVISEGETTLSDYNSMNTASTFTGKFTADYAWPQQNLIYNVARTGTTSYPCEVYKKYDKKWFKYTTASNKDYDEGAGFHYTNDGKFIFYNYEYNHTGLIVDNCYNFITLPTYCIYLGTHNNKSYVINKYYGYIYEYDPATNTLISDILYTTGRINYGTINNGRIIVASPTCIFILKFDTDDSIVEESKTTGTNIYVREITGTDLGDYMFTTTTTSTHAVHNASLVGYLKCYKIYFGAYDGKYSYVENTPAILEKFTTQPCTINYNPRNCLLTIGTTDGVYLYKYTPIINEFTEIPLELELPEKADAAMYRGCTSPDGSELLVSTVCASKFSTAIYLTGYNSTVALKYDAENIRDKSYIATVSDTSLPYKTVETTTIKPYTANITFNISPSANNLILVEGEN